MNDIEKATKGLNILKTDIQHNLTKGNLLKRNLISSKDLLYLLNIAITALEKQVPKKPKHDDYWNVKVCECGQQAVKGIRYCPWCGQKIDWGIK